MLFRDACVLPVWEGTTDVLASETTRALSRDSARSEVVGYIRQLAAGRRGFGGYLKEEEAVEECGKLEVKLIYLFNNVCSHTWRWIS